MEQTNKSFFDGTGAVGAELSGAARATWIVLILATIYLCYFHNLGIIGFVGPDEPRYAWVAREMSETGDWVTPRLYGKPWFEKPVLYYWEAAASFRLFGVSEAAARLPSAICALLATLSMGWLARRLYGAETARWLLLLLPTTVGMIGFSHAAATDMPFSGMLTVAMVFAAVIVGLTRDGDSPVVRKTPWLALLAFGFFLGLAVLAKGPAAIILSGSAVLIWGAFAKRWRDAFRCLHPVAIASFCATALPWYVSCTLRNPDFFRAFLIEHNFKRFLTPEFQHVQPVWYYVPVMLIAFLPWTVVLLWSGYVGLSRLRSRPLVSATSVFLLCWALFPVLFFSISKSKLPGYVLPAIPALALLLVRVTIQYSDQYLISLRWFSLAAGCGFAVAGIAAWFVLGHIQSLQNAPAARVAALLLLSFALANLLTALRTSSRLELRSIAPICVFPLLVSLLFAGAFIPRFLPRDPSAKILASELFEANVPLDEVYVGGMHRAHQYALNFYIHHEIVEWNPQEPREGYLLRNSKRCDESLVRLPFHCGDDPIELSQSGWFVYRVKLQN